MNNNSTLIVALFAAVLFCVGCSGVGTHRNAEATTLNYDTMMRMDFARIEGLAKKGNSVAQYAMAEFYLNGHAAPRPDEKIAIEWLKKSAKTGVGVPLVSNIYDNTFRDNMVGRLSMLTILGMCESQKDFIKHDVDADQILDSLRIQYKGFIDSASNGDLRSKMEAFHIVHQGEYFYLSDSKGEEKVLWVVKPDYEKAKELHKSILASIQEQVPDLDFELMNELGLFLSSGFPKTTSGEYVMPEISKPDEATGSKWMKKAQQVATEQAKAGNPKATYFLFEAYVAVAQEPEPWLIELLGRLANKGEVRAIENMILMSITDGNPADALYWHRILGALRRVDPFQGEEYGNEIYKRLNDKQISEIAFKAERWLQEHSDLAAQSNFLRIVANADLETLDKSGKKIQNPRMVSSGKPLEGITVLRGLKKPFTGKMRGSVGPSGWRGEIDFLEGKVHGKTCLWDNNEIKRNEMVFNQGQPILERQWLQSGKLASEKRWDDKGNLIPPKK